MVGGGPGAFIGAVHRRAATLDGLAELVAGAFSSNAEKSAAHGRELHLAPERVYASYEEMAEREAALPEDERIDFVSIVTPNHLHFPVARTFVERGFHVICDKPLTTTLEDAEALCRLVEERGVIFALTHNYTGYPMVKQARALVQEGCARWWWSTPRAGSRRSSRPRGASRRIGAPTPRGRARARSATSAPTPRIWHTTSPGWRWRSCSPR
jgi:predicted dehydrogenase